MWNSRETPADTLPSASPALRRFALVAVYGFGFFAPWSIAAGELFQLFLFIATVITVARYPRWALREPLLWLAALFVAYVLIRGWFAVLERPDLSAAHWEGASHWIKSGPLAILVVAIGFGLLGDWRRHVPRVFGLWMVGVLINAVRYFSAPAVLASLNGSQRFTFGLMQIEAGVAYMTALLLVMTFAPSLIARRQRPLTHYASIAFAILVAVVLFTGLVITKTRTAWIAGAAAVVVMAGLAGWAWWRGNHGDLRRPPAVAGCALVLVIVLGAVFGHRMTERMIPALDTMAAIPRVIMGADFDTIKADSLGKRVAFWVFAARAFANRPLFGYGPADVRYLMRERPVPPQIEGEKSQLHSGYSQIFNRFGLVGGLPIILLIGFVFRAAARLIRQSDGTAIALGVSAAGFTTMMLTVAIAEQRLEDFDIVQVYSLMLGAALAPSIIARLQADGFSR